MGEELRRAVEGAPRGPILLKGFIVDPYCPGVSRLTVTIDVTGMPRGALEDWARKVARVLSEVDAKYSSRPESVRGRTVRARLIHVGDEQRKVVRVMYYPSTIANRLRNIKDRLYGEVIPRHCIVLGRSAERRLYFLPAKMAPSLLSAVDELNRRLEGLRRMCREYEESGDYEDVMGVLSEFAPSLREAPPRARIPDVRVNLVPLSLSDELLREVLEERAARAMREIDEARRREMERIREEMERTRAALIAEAAMDLQSRIAEVLRRLGSYARGKMTRERLRALREDLREVEELAASAGVHSALRSVVRAAASVVDAVEGGRQEDLRRAAEEVAELAGVSPLDDPARTVALAAERLQARLAPAVKSELASAVSERALALLEEL